MIYVFTACPDGCETCTTTDDSTTTCSVGGCLGAHVQISGDSCIGESHGGVRPRIRHILKILGVSCFVVKQEFRRLQLTVFKLDNFPSN